MKKIMHEPDFCPVCGAGDLCFGDFQHGLSGDIVYYPWECKTCKSQGREYYDLKFDEHVITLNTKNPKRVRKFKFNNEITIEAKTKEKAVNKFANRYALSFATDAECEEVGE